MVPGNIIVRQRGTVFHPGQNVRLVLTTCRLSSPLTPHFQVKIGRDHTIYAVVPGFVRFYKEKYMRGDRRYVGVVLNRGEVLPRDESALGRSRYFGLVNLRGGEKELERLPMDTSRLDAPSTSLQSTA